MTSLRTIELRCPVCRNHFTSRAVDSTDSMAGESTDFHARSVGVQPLAYLVHLCERCGYEFAAKVASWQGEQPRRLGELWLRAAWCCVDENDVEGERYYRRHAVWAFEEALATYDGVGRDERALITYLVGELWRRIGDEQRAKKWFDRVPVEITSPTRQRWVADAARQQKHQPREWFRRAA